MDGELVRRLVEASELHGDFFLSNIPQPQFMGPKKG